MKYVKISIKGVVRMDFESALANSENETVKLLVSVLGTEKALALIMAAGGAPVYIPSIKTITLEERNTQIYREFINGATYKELHIKYKLTEKSIREIINNKLKCK
jgi:Mor family transcriptional regulator